MEENRVGGRVIVPRRKKVPRTSSTKVPNVNCKIAVVTVIIGNYEPALKCKEVTSPASCTFVFTDRESERMIRRSQRKCFRSVILTAPGVEPIVVSRAVEMMTHCLLPNVSFVLYTDAKIIMQFRFAVDLHQHMISKRAAWVSPMHQTRHSIEDEAVCLYLSNMVTRDAFRQVRQYREAGLTSNSLIEGEWHMKNMYDDRVRRHGAAWFKEFTSWNTRRDQLSFEYAAWVAAMPVTNASAKKWIVRRGGLRNRSTDFPILRKIPNFKQLYLKSHMWCDYPISRVENAQNDRGYRVRHGSEVIASVAKRRLVLVFLCGSFKVTPIRDHPRLIPGLDDHSFELKLSNGRWLSCTQTLPYVQNPTLVLVRRTPAESNASGSMVSRLRVRLYDDFQCSKETNAATDTSPMLDISVLSRDRPVLSRKS